MSQDYKESFTPFDIWEKFGITSHQGGIRATQQLAQHAQIASGQIILEIGCGTGYTACQLAKDYHDHIVALDLTPQVLQTARDRATAQGVSSAIAFTQADVHNLPFPANIFDRVIVESVLVFCALKQAPAEIYRVLKPGGVLAANELSLLKPASEELLTLLQETIRLRALQESEWRGVFENAGFVELSSATHRLNLRGQFADHIKIDGLRNYLTAVVRGITDKTIRSTFFNRTMLKAARQFPPYIGYGLYVGKKPEQAASKRLRNQPQ
jgi:ubiquinone/menaquinone biosynthesis C-methylase UbiE